MLKYAELRALGLDTDEGLACCAEDPEFYEEMLGEYVSEAKTGLEELDRCFRAGDWKGYGLRAHSVKSTSHMIGATKLSELARQLEVGAKEGAANAVLSSHGEFYAAYRALAEGIQAIIG